MSSCPCRSLSASRTERSRTRSPSRREHEYSRTLAPPMSTQRSGDLTPTNGGLNVGWNLCRALWRRRTYRACILTCASILFLVIARRFIAYAKLGHVTFAV